METEAVFSFTLLSLGEIVITHTVVITWLIMIGVGLFSWIATRSLSMDPSPLQSAVEGVISAMEAAIGEVAPGHEKQLLPFIGTLWIFIVIANLVSLIPGISSPTRDLSTTAGLAILVFLSTLWYGIRSQGFKNYFRHYLSPSPILLPFHLVSEVSRTIALAVRLFGNMMSLEMAALLILMVAGFLVPVPILMLHVVEALVQAYIFGMLALIYVGGGIQSHEIRVSQEE